MKHVSEPLTNVLIHIAKQSESNRARIIALIEDLKRKLDKPAGISGATGQNQPFVG